MSPQAESPSQRDLLLYPATNRIRTYDSRIEWRGNVPMAIA